MQKMDNKLLSSLCSTSNDALRTSQPGRVRTAQLYFLNVNYGTRCAPYIMSNFRRCYVPGGSYFFTVVMLQLVRWVACRLEWGTNPNINNNI